MCLLTIVIAQLLDPSSVYLDSPKVKELNK